MRTSSSGGWMSATSPDAKRSRRRASNSSRSRGSAVARQHELAPALVERVEGVEELLLGLDLVGEELDVVEEQHVDAAEALAERVGIALPEGGTKSLVNSSTVA